MKWDLAGITLTAALLVSSGRYAGPVKADLTVPTETAVSFKLNGQPYKKPVSYTVTCFGQEIRPGQAPAKVVFGQSKVFSYSASCESYPCSINQEYYLNYRRIDFCNLDGTTEGKHFSIKNFGKSPATGCTYSTYGNCSAEFEIPADQLQAPVK